MKKIFKTGLLALLAFSLFVTGIRSVETTAESTLVPNNTNISENFEGYQQDDNLEISNSFQQDWYTRADSGTGSMTVVDDPVDANNKVAKVTGSTYYTIVPRNIITKNCTISYRVNPITTIGTHWVATQFRKQAIGDINGGNGVFWLYHTRFGSKDNKTVLTDTVPHNAPADNTFTQWDSEPLVIESGVKGKWFEVTNIIQDNYVYNYVNGYLLNVSYTSHSFEPGYIGIHSLCIDFYLDDIVITTEDEYQFTVKNEVEKAGEATISRSSGNKDSVIELSAKPNAGYEFIGWYENGELISSTPEYTVSTPTTGDREFEVRWLASKYTLSVTSYDDGRGTQTGGGTFESGENALLTAKATQGYKFAGWYKDDVFVSSEAEYTYTTTAEDVNIKAKYVPEEAQSRLVSISLQTNDEAEIVGGAEISATAGTVAIAGQQTSFYEGQIVTLTAKSEYVYTFVGWFDSQTEECISSESTYSFEISSDLSVKAVFKDRLFVLSVTNGVDKEQTTLEYLYGTTVELTPDIPLKGYSFSTWNCSANDITISGTKLVVTVTEDMDIQAIYAKNKNKLLISNNAKELGGVSGGYALGAGEISYGEKVTIRPIANEGFVLSGIEVDGVVGTLNTDGSFTFVMPDNPVQIYLKFAKSAEEKTGYLGLIILAGVLALSATAVFIVLSKRKNKK